MTWPDGGFAVDGFAVVADVLSPDECDELERAACGAGAPSSSMRARCTRRRRTTALPRAR